MATVAYVDLVIDLHSKTPSYIQLADKIKAAIDSGEMTPRSAIPSLRELVDQSGLSMSTVQRAIRQLERDSRVYTVIGRGIFVTPRNIDAS